MDTKKIRCISEKFGIENQLIQYHEILERNPKLLVPLNEMELIRYKDIRFTDYLYIKYKRKDEIA